MLAPVNTLQKKRVNTLGDRFKGIYDLNSVPLYVVGDLFNAVVAAAEKFRSARKGLDHFRPGYVMLVVFVIQQFSERFAVARIKPDHSNSQISHFISPLFSMSTDCRRLFALSR